MSVPSFADIGKSVKDLFKKKFDYSNTVKVKQSTSNGLTVESTAFLSGLTGKCNAKYVNAGWGEAETTVQTTGEANTKFTFKKLAKDLKLTVKATANDKKSFGGALNANVTALFKQPNFTVEGGVDVVQDKKQTYGVATASAVVGLDGLSIGGLVEYDQQAQDFSDFGSALQYQEDDFTFSLKTESMGEVVEAGWFQKVRSGFDIGYKFRASPFATDSADFRVLSAATEYKVDPKTTFKGQVSTKGDVAAALEHTLADPSLKLNVAAAWKATCIGNGASWDASLTPAKAGVGFTFGEF